MFIAIVAGLVLVSAWWAMRWVARVGRRAEIWIPAVAQSHIAFVEKTSTSSERIADAVEELTSSNRILSASHDKTHRAIGKALTAAKRACKDHKLDEVHDLLEEAQDELDR